MDDIELKLLNYDALSSTERAEAEAHLAAHPEASALVDGAAEVAPNIGIARGEAASIPSTRRRETLARALNVASSTAHPFLTCASYRAAFARCP